MSPRAGSRQLPTRRLHAGWVLAVFMTSVATVVCFVVAAAWVLGGRTAPSTPSVQTLLPPEDQPESTEDGQPSPTGTVPTTAAEQPETVSVNGEVAVALPGARGGAEIFEVPVESLSYLKPIGWAVPYLSRPGYEPVQAETGTIGGVRTIQVHLTDGEHIVSVSETRPEEDDVELAPLEEKIADTLDVSSAAVEDVPLSTGDEARVYVDEETETWTAGIQTHNVQYVITSDTPAERAGEITSWVMITDRSRVQVDPSTEPAGPTDRLERGFDELVSWFTD